MFLVHWFFASNFTIFYWFILNKNYAIYVWDGFESTVYLLLSYFAFCVLDNKLHIMVYTTVIALSPDAAAIFFFLPMN